MKENRIMYFCTFCKKVGTRPNTWKKNCWGEECQEHFIQRVFPEGYGKSSNALFLAGLIKHGKLKKDLIKSLEKNKWNKAADYLKNNEVL